jgi:hypothetical protein
MRICRIPIADEQPTTHKACRGYLLDFRSICRLAVLLGSFAVAIPLCMSPMNLLGEQRRVTARFLDPRSGKPIRKMWVWVTLYKGNPPKGPIPAEYVVSRQNVRTDVNGEVVAVLHDPLPTFISIHSFDLSYGGSLISVDEVLKSGVVLDYSDKSPPEGYWVDKEGRRSMKSGRTAKHNGSKAATITKPVPQPGVIVFIERRLTRSDRVRQELP